VLYEVIAFFRRSKSAARDCACFDAPCVERLNSSSGKGEGIMGAKSPSIPSLSFRDGGGLPSVPRIMILFRVEELDDAAVLLSSVTFFML